MIDYEKLMLALKSMEHTYVNPVEFLLDGEEWAIGYFDLRGDFVTLFEGVTVADLDKWLHDIKV